MNFKLIFLVILLLNLSSCHHSLHFSKQKYTSYKQVKKSNSEVDGCKSYTVDIFREEANKTQKVGSAGPVESALAVLIVLTCLTLCVIGLAHTGVSLAMLLSYSLIVWAVAVGIALVLGILVVVAVMLYL